MKLYGVQPS